MAALSHRPAPPLSAIRPLIAAGLLLAALALGGRPGSPPAPAEAAPPRQDTVTNLRFYLNVEQPSQYCAGETYTIPVTPLVEISGVNAQGRRFTDSDRLVTGAVVRAETQDVSIAQITPASQGAGALNIHRASTFSTQQQNFNTLNFRLEARKAGATNLYLTAEAPARYGSGGSRYFGPRGAPVAFPIQVVNCEYRVIVTYWWQMAGVGFRIWEYGRVDTKIKATDPEFYGGDGTFSFMLSHFDLTCSRLTGHEIATHITARRNFATDQLELTFQNQPPTGTITETCPNSFLLANAGWADPAAPWNGTAIFFPVAGGTQTLWLSPNIPGPRPPPAEVKITVLPVAPGGR